MRSVPRSSKQKAGLGCASSSPSRTRGVFAMRSMRSHSALARGAAPAKVLTLEFTLPLQQPVLVEAPDFSFSVYDPSWFIAFELADVAAIKLGPGAPAECRLISGDTATTGTDAPRRIEDAFSGQFGGSATVTLSGTKLIKLSCGSKS